MEKEFDLSNCCYVESRDIESQALSAIVSYLTSQQSDANNKPKEEVIKKCLETIVDAYTIVENKQDGEASSQYVAFRDYIKQADCEIQYIEGENLLDTLLSLLEQIKYQAETNENCEYIQNRIEKFSAAIRMAVEEDN